MKILKFEKYITEISTWKKSWVNDDWGREIGSEYPPNEIFEYIESFHDVEDNDTDFYERVFNHQKYILKEILMDSLNLDEYTLDDDKVEEYENGFKEYKKYPPIVVDDENSIIDGLHRANALKNLGYNTIKAYVGDGSPDF